MDAASLRHRSPGPGFLSHRAPRWLAGCAVLAAAVLTVGCGPDKPARSRQDPVVYVTTPITEDVLDYQDFTGRMDAFRTVDIRARVTGYVDEAPFKEGDRVAKGAVLFRIDSRSFKADLNQAEANLKQALADRELQELNAGRARRMVSSRAIGKEEFDQIMAAREKSKATVLAMEAARDRAALYLDYTSVIAPIGGRISRRNVDPGNLVKADDTMLTTIVADDTVYAYFDVDERTYLDLVGEKPSATPSAHVSELRFPVLMRLANEDDFSHPGYVDFVDNRLNGNTGTIRMRGVFTNPRGALKSGLFVRIRLPSGTPYRAILIPDQALQSDQGRHYLWVVTRKKDEETGKERTIAEYRTVSPGQSIKAARGDDEKYKALRVIKDGLKPGERVVIEGMQRVRRGEAVDPRPRDPPKQPGFPLLKLVQQEQAKIDAMPKPAGADLQRAPRPGGQRGGRGGKR
jgi:RND family efflux transporter MFP subunit